MVPTCAGLDCGMYIRFEVIGCTHYELQDRNTRLSYLVPVSGYVAMTMYAV